MILLWVINMVEVISFDMDGTLIKMSFYNYLYRSLIPQMVAEKKHIDKISALDFVEKSYESIGCRNVKYYDLNYWIKKFKLNTTKEEIIQKLLHRIEVFEDAVYIVDRLCERYELVICSHSPEYVLIETCKLLPNKFKKVISTVSMYNDIKSKPVFLKICKDLGINKSELTHIGDSYEFDYFVPKSCGIKSYYLDRSGIKNKNNGFMINSLYELDSIL